VVGLGYVGLTTAACFSSRGIRVLGIDVDESRVKKIVRGETVLKEPGLDSLIKQGLRSGTLKIRPDFSGVGENEIVFLTVGTPSRSDGSIDTAYVEDAAMNVGEALRHADGLHTIVVKSTVVPGTTRGRIKPIIESASKKKVGGDLGLGVNPEFLFEGSAVKDTMNPEALVLGTTERRTENAVLRLYRSFYKKLPPLIRTTPENAELMKYAINSFRAVQVSYVNFIANLCSRIEGGEMDDITRGLEVVARMDKRYLGAGLGFGGSCLPKDSKALRAFAESIGVEPAILTSAIRMNEAQPREAVGMAEKLAGDLRGKRVAVLGLAFKQGTDDIRDSTAIEVVHEFLQKGADVVVFDPAAMENARTVLGAQVHYAKTPEACISAADVCIMATGWNSFRGLKPSTFRDRMRTPLVVDGRRILDPRIFRAKGVRVLKLGTAPSD
jgi:UDPglucose 6-dehydrogenase